MIITDSSVIEDLLTAFHYQQQTYNETERDREEEEGESKRGGEEALIVMRRRVVVVVIGVGGRLPQDGRVSEGIRKGREMGEEEEEEEVEVVCNSERVREIEREIGRE